MDNQIISNIKTLGIDMIKEAGSGHPGIVLGASTMLYTLFAKHLNITAKDPNWENRDRLVMSAGHGSALLYATLFMAGLLNLDDLKNFRKIGSKTPGHPERNITPFVEVSTGPLGQGLATAVGMALAEKRLEEQTILPHKNILEARRSLIDHYIYVICSDGDIMEGITSEAASLAGNLKLNHLIVLYDSNDVTLDGSASLAFNEKVLDKFKAMGWNTEYVKNGEDVKEISKAIECAKRANEPTIIEIKTVIGKGSLREGTNYVHGGVLDNEDINQLKTKLGIPTTPFYVNEAARQNFKVQVINHSSEKYGKWASNYHEFVDEDVTGNAENIKFIFKDNQIYDITKYRYNINTENKKATRVLNGEIMNEIARNINNFIGGSADLATTTKTYLKNMGDITKDDHRGRNIWFGIREHAMGAILNGLALYNFKVFGSTFLAFSDYMKPSIRMSALMKLPVNYIFTHDAANIGADGPTHQPVEQLVSLRSIPNLNVFRPCDANEIIGCWNVMLNSKTTPNALILSRLETESVPNSNMYDVAKGAYIIKKEENNLEGVIIATGSEVSLALHIAEDLYRTNKISLRVVSMPCQELFLKQLTDYQESILPKGIKKIVIEASSSFSWYQFVYNEKYLFNVNDFGVSASTSDVLKYLEFDYESIKKKIYKLFR